MFQVHSNKIVDVASKIGVVGLAIAVIYQGSVWVGEHLIEQAITTEPETDQKIADYANMHNKENLEAGYAMVDDVNLVRDAVNHLTNNDVDERVQDAANEIAALEKKRELNPNEFTELDAFKLEIFKRDIIGYREGYVIEFQHDHKRK